MRKRVVSGPRILLEYQIKVRCTCNWVFGVQLEARKKNRKTVDLDGLWTKIYQIKRWGHPLSESLLTNCKISNLSLDGIGLTLTGKQAVCEGDHLIIKFRLDTSSSPIIEKEAVVKWVKDNEVGCEFFDKDRHDKTLGLYLL